MLGEMIRLNEPQVWTLIGVFAASMFALIGVVSTLLLRVLRAEIGGVRAEIGGVHAEIGGVHSEIGGLRAEMEAGFRNTDQRLDRVERDLRVVFRRVFPDLPDAG